MGLNRNSELIYDESEIERHLETAERIAGTGSWTNDLVEGRLTWSANVFEIFGWDPGTKPSFERFVASIHPDDRAMFFIAHEEAFLGRRPYLVDHRVLRPDGVVRFVHEQAEIERDPSGTPIRLVGVVSDQTEQLRQEERRQALQNRRSELLHLLIDKHAKAQRDLASRLHDGPIQHLTLAALELDSVEDDVVHPTADALRGIIDDLRSMLMALDPASLRTMSTSRAVSALVAHLVPDASAEIVVSGEFVDDGPAGPVVEHVVDALRVCARLEATKINIDFSWSPSDLALTIVASGSARIESQADHDARPLEMLWFEERAHSAGGWATVVAAEGQLTLRSVLPHNVAP
ncbi:MAG: PAS domain-containing protein [Acidimicrobiales bacterium]